MNYLDNATYRRQKSALTRAINSGDARKIIETVEKTMAAWDEGNYAWPDDWSRWERAKDDAGMMLRRAGWGI